MAEGEERRGGDTGPYHTARKCKLLRNNLVVRHACEHHGQSVSSQSLLTLTAWSYTSMTGFFDRPLRRTSSMRHLSIELLAHVLV